MPLRKRLSLVAAAAVAVSIATAAGVCYWVVRNQLRSQIDQTLTGQAVLIQHNVPNALASQIPGLPASAGGPGTLFADRDGGQYRAPNRRRPPAAL